MEPWLLDLLDHLGMRECFDALAVSGLVGVEKPDAAFFERALEIAEATRDETVHIGDSFYADVQGAWGANLDAIWNQLGTAGRHGLALRSTPLAPPRIAVIAAARRNEAP